MVVLRVKEPTLERPYKTFITTPLLFSAVRPTEPCVREMLTRHDEVALFLLCMPIVAAPLEALAAFGMPCEH